MYVIILYSYNKNEPYVYDVVSTSDELITQFDTVKFSEYEDYLHLLILILILHINGIVSVHKSINITNHY